MDFLAAFPASLSVSYTLLTSVVQSVVSPLTNSNPDIEFSTASPLAVDACVYLNFSVMFVVLFFVVRHVVAHPVAHCVLQDPTPAKVAKFGDSAVELAGYVCFLIIGVSISSTLPWLWPSVNWWIDAPHRLMRNDVRCWYIWDGSRYTAGLFSLVFLEHKRKDFWQMFVHHIATIVVTMASYIAGYYRVGTIVKLVMDPADIPLHAAKLCKYIGDGRAKKNVFNFLADRCFELFAVVFFVTRLVMYGYVVWACIFEGPNYTPMNDGAKFCIACLSLLLVLQVWWFGLLFNMAIKLARGGDLKDLRSDDEAEEEDEATTATSAGGKPKTE